MKKKHKKLAVKFVLIMAGIGLLLTTFLPFITLLTGTGTPSHGGF